MKHYIIVKYNNTTADQASLFHEISALFHRSTDLEGIHEVNLYRSVIDLPNRYDLMIVIDMKKEALPIFDQSDIHHIWKETYAKYIESKVIFDA